ncbi:hypothetical protein AGMMS49975_29710 [Clostridia bacterium]|nr:hypothetical protein AGMMS49975_29710 [Clostridia bacterium]
MERDNAKIIGINGPVITVAGLDSFGMSETVYVGAARLIGEVIRVTKKFVTIQVFEDTSGLKLGEEIYKTGRLLSVTPGPGIITNIFDGIERPLPAIEKESGIFIDKGVHVTNLDTARKWDTKVLVKEGDEVSAGQVVAEVQETQSVLHRVMIPPNVRGRVVSVAASGAYDITEVVAEVLDLNGNTRAIKLAQEWPIKTARPVSGGRFSRVR